MYLGCTPASKLVFTNKKLILEKALIKVLAEETGEGNRASIRHPHPHNRIHKFLVEAGLAKEEPKEKRRRKPYVRYEREHSMSAAHIDWFEKDGIKFCASG